MKIGKELKKIKIDGQKVSYLEKGNKSKPGILLIHTFGSSSLYYASFMRQLENDFYLVAPDLPGFGESEVFANSAHNLKNYTNFIEKFVQIVGLEKFFLIGSSLGSLVSIVFASKYKNKVKKIVLHAPPWIKEAYGLRYSDKFLNGGSKNGRIVKLASRLKTKLDKRILSKILQFAYKDISHIEAKKGLLSYFVKNADLTAACEVWLDIKNIDLRKEAKSISSPVLIIAGENDKTVKPLEVVKLTNVLKNSKLKLFEGKAAIHGLFLKKPKKLAQLIKKYINKN